MLRTLTLLITVLSAGLVFAACSPESQTPTETTDTPAQEQSAANSAVDADQQLTIDMFNFGYSQEEIEAAPGETLEITLTNSEGYHDFVIDELDVDSGRTNAGEEATVTFTIPEDASPGDEYSYYCSVGNHRAQGQEGVLRVVAAE